MMRQPLVTHPADPFVLSREELADWRIAAHIRHVGVAMVSAEGFLAVNGRPYATQHQAAKARRAFAMRLVAAERAYQANPNRLKPQPPFIPIRLNALKGVLTVRGRCTAIRPLRCLACYELMPAGTDVKVHAQGVINLDPQHRCFDRCRDILLYDPIREALELPDDHEQIRFRELPELCY